MTSPTLTGHSIVGGTPLPGTGGTLRAVDPATGEEFGPDYTLLTPEQVTDATALAAQAAPSYAALTPAQRADFLLSAAANIDAAADALVERAGRETGLPAARLTGEVARTSNQLRLFAAVVRQGDHLGARIDPAQPERTPLPRVDIRQRKVTLGPVAVFGASNFPLAFSTAGGDTASALAAGCPVVYKAHEAHPGTTEIVGRALADAIAEHQLHPGVFSVVQGSGPEVGQALAADVRIAAIGFTGSRRAGLALAETAARRPVPIPVYAEMSSANPVAVLDGAIAGEEKARALAEAYVTSVTGSAGQLCTQPGLVFVPAGQRGDDFVAQASRLIGEAGGQVMLTAGIADAARAGIRRWREAAGVEILAEGAQGEGPNAPAPVLAGTTLATFRAHAALQEEVFGPVSLVVRYDSAEELALTLQGLEGQLTGTIQLDTDSAADLETARTLLPVFEHLAGRILVNGWPTGVEVGHAMVHGGPFPSTSNAATTSVGSLAIERFLRPIAYQNLPQELLAPELQDANPWSLTRRVDGDLMSA